MKRIYKYGTEIEKHFTIDMPKGAEILSAKLQNGKPFMWALVDNDAPLETRKFRLAGTGHIINNKNLKFIDTLMMHGGTLVLHLFEVEA